MAFSNFRLDLPVDARVIRRAGKRAAAACAVVAVAALALAGGARAAEPAGSGAMKMDEPMAGEMKKEGAKKRDVKQHAEKWDKKMKDMMEKENKAAGEGSARK